MSDNLAKTTDEQNIKSQNAYKTIGETSIEVDIPQHVLRFWETKFKQIQPIKGPGGRRYYRQEDLVIIQKIKKALYQDGFTIKGVQKLLSTKTNTNNRELLKKEIIENQSAVSNIEQQINIRSGLVYRIC